MKSIFFAFLILLVPVQLFAQQTIAPNVSDVAGVDGQLNGIFVTAAIGEPAIVTLKTEQVYITQGFLQPEILPCTRIEIVCYPNPTTDILTLQVDGCEVGVQSVQVLDLWGRVIMTVTKPKDNQLSFGDFAQGVYLLKVKLTNDDVYAISVVKISD